MTIRSWLTARSWKLPPAVTKRVRVDRKVPVAMRDGTVLLGDHYCPEGASGLPVVLVRCPYGRGAGFALTARLFAERGFQVFVQSCRGTFGSGGSFEPVRQEPRDGMDTIEWIERQPWFGGKLFTFGMSYLGFVQWAVARQAGSRIGGMNLQFTLANFRNEVLPHGGNSLEGTLGWATMMARLTAANSGLALIRAMLGKIAPETFAHLPLREVDALVVGRAVPWWQDWMAHCDPSDPWWDEIDFTKALPAVAAPANLVAGWDDLFLPWQVKDFELLQEAGRDAWLTIGPWHHTAQAGGAEAMRQGLELVSALAEGRRPFEERGRVRVFVQRAEEWRDFASWPPTEARELRMFLGGDGGLVADPPAEGPDATGFVFDPADPTPSLHPPSPFGGPAKLRDMAPLVARADTACFTGPALDHDTDVIGPVLAEIHYRTDAADSDLYACLCDVDEQGRSIKVCDGYLRLPRQDDGDAGQARMTVVECGPTGYRFRAGHRIRLIVAGGAHPRFARNLGTGEPLSTGVRMVPQATQILHGRSHPSALRLPVVER